MEVGMQLKYISEKVSDYGKEDGLAHEADGHWAKDPLFCGASISLSYAYSGIRICS